MAYHRLFLDSSAERYDMRGFEAYLHANSFSYVNK